MSATLYGNPSVTELAPTRVLDPLKGNSTTRRFRGLEQHLYAIIPGLRAQYPQSVIRVEPGPDSSSEAMLYVPIAGTEDGSDPNSDANTQVTWGCPPAQEPRDIFLHPRYKSLDAATKKLIEIYRQNLSTVTAPFSISGDSKQFCDLVTDHGFNYLKLQFGVRKTIRLPSGATILNVNQYNGQVFTRAQMVSLFAPPTQILTQMPSGAGDLTIEGEYLCHRSELSQTDKGGWEIVFEWIHGFDIAFLYPRWT